MSQEAPVEVTVHAIEGSTNYLPVAFVIDNQYAVPAAVAMTSILQNKRSDACYRFYICANGLSPDYRLMLGKLEAYAPNTQVLFIDLDLGCFNEIYVPYDGNTGAGSITALGKFLLCELLPEDVCLYLDADILVKQDISAVFETDLNKYVAGVVMDSGRIYNSGGLRGRLPKYFNSGVMLLNLKMMRELDMGAKLVTAKKSLNNINLVDQDAFNLAFRGLTTLLPVRYNALMINLHNSAGNFTMGQFNTFFDSQYTCLQDLEDDVCVLHFASKMKPWLYKDVLYSDEWYDYYEQSPCSSPLERTYFSSEGQRGRPLVVPVILATDANYLPQTAVTIVSVLENARSAASFAFYILVPELFDDEVQKRFVSTFSSYENCEIDFIAMQDAFCNAQLNISHITTPTFYRLKAPSLFPQYDKVVYLDSDVVVEGDLAEYFDIDLGDAYVAGVKAASYHAAKNGNKLYCEQNGLPSIDQYINAGVILLNLRALREHEVESEFIRRAGLGYRSQDQDVLNGACYGHIKHLAYKYNCQISKYESTPEIPRLVFNDAEINEANNLPFIIHYAGPEKPWKSFECALGDRWWKYAKLTPYYEQFLLENSGSLLRYGREFRLERINGDFYPKRKGEKLEISNESLYSLIARVDVRNIGEHNPSVEIFEISDASAKVDDMTWVTDGGFGRYVESAMGNLSLKARCLGSGTLEVALRGKNILDEDGRRMPYWIDFTSLVINEGCVCVGSLQEPVSVWHDRPRKFLVPVEDGDVVTIVGTWRPHAEAERDTVLGELTTTRQELASSERRLAALSRTSGLANLVTARVDLRNAGPDSNNVRVLELTDPAAREADMGWCATGGHGRYVESAEGELSLRVRCEGEGTLELALRGRHVPDGAGGREAFWVNYTSLVVDGGEQLDAPVAVWHDQPFKLRRPVADGEELSISLAWRPHAEAERDAAREELAAVREEFAATEELLAASRERAGRLRAKVDALKGKLSASRERARSLERKNRELRVMVREQRGANKELREQAKELRAQNKKLRMSNKQLAAKAASYRASVSWKIGRAVTWLPRKLRALIKRG